MKPRILATLVLLLSVQVGGAAAADKDDTETAGLENGRFWNALSEDATRSEFLLGILDGWKLREQTEDAVRGTVINALSSCGGSFTYAELAEMVTAAYNEPENRPLPIGWVMMADLAIQCGHTTREAVFPALRKHLAEVSGPGVLIKESAMSPIDTILSASTKQH